MSYDDDDDDDDDADAADDDDDDDGGGDLENSVQTLFMPCFTFTFQIQLKTESKTYVTPRFHLKP